VTTPILKSGVPAPSAKSGTAAEYFGGMVASYDSLIRRAVPRYEEMTQRLLEHLAGDPTTILELGCGTGNLTLKLLGRFPEARVVAVDASPEMTEATAERARSITGAPDRLKVIRSRFEELDQPAGAFDLITSSMSLHHVQDKGELYRRFAVWLRPGRQLAFADQLLGRTELSQSVHWALWLKHCREPGHCTLEETASLLEHAAEHDHYEPLERHFDLLRGAGFEQLDCVWRNGMYSVVTAVRGGP
jgi:tRNA (cmo5U34)-methyltransferase